jgi:hypothetical protein
MSTPTDEEQAILNGICESFETNRVEGYTIHRWRAGINIWFKDCPAFPGINAKLSSITLEPRGDTLLVQARSNAFLSRDVNIEFADPQFFSQLQQFLGQFGVAFE